MFSVRLVTPSRSRTLSLAFIRFGRIHSVSHSPKPNLTHIVLFLFIINIIVAPPGCCHRARPSFVACFVYVFC